VKLSHQPEHLLRAVVEGLAFELERQIGLLRQAELPVKRLVLSGSAAESLVTPQIIADVTKLPVACVAKGGGSPLGAAILARGLLEPATSLADLASQMSTPTRNFEPGHAASFYHQRYSEYLRSLSGQAHRT
jgi:xylulokinase